MQGYTTEERDANAKQNLTQFYALMFDAVSDFYFIFFHSWHHLLDLTNHPFSLFRQWTDARRPVPRLWIRSAEVRGERR